MENYKPNSNKFKNEQKEIQDERRKVDKIVTGNVKTRKNEIRKFADVFISEDAHNVKSYIFSDVFIPAIKKLVSDIVKDGIEMILYGSTGGRNRSSGNKPSYVSYNNYSDRRDPSYTESRPITRYSYEELILENRGEAEAVLDNMRGMIDTYGMASVADLYDLVGKTGNYTDNKYGWTDLRTAEIVRMRDGGYLIKMPRILPLK